MFRGICADGATTRGAPVVTEGVCVRTLSMPRTDTPLNGGHDIVDDCEDAAVVGPWFPAASWTELEFNREINVPAPVQLTVTVIVVPDVAEVVYTHPVAVPVFENADADRPEIASLKVKVYDAESEDELVAVDHEAVGGVVSDAEMETDTDCVPPANVVCALGVDAVSVTENDPDAASDDTTVPPPCVAVDVALMVHVVEFI
jgi:hypothetical protein